jgi:hypothetical protein
MISGTGAIACGILSRHMYRRNLPHCHFHTFEDFDPRDEAKDLVLQHCLCDDGKRLEGDNWQSVSADSHYPAFLSSMISSSMPESELARSWYVLAMESYFFLSR